MQDKITLSFNREMAREYGVTAALIYQEVYRKYFYWREQGKLQDGMFWCDQKAMAEWLLISTQTLYRTVKVLKEAGLISTETHYKPGSSETTTWWKITECETTTSQNVMSCETSQNVTSYIKSNKTADTQQGSAEMESTDSEEESDGGEHMRPEVLYTRVKSFWKGPNELRKQKVAALEQLQEDLSDETIIEGFRLIAAHPTITLSNGEEFTYTLTNMLVREDLTKTAVNLVKAVEKSQNKKKKVISGGICY